MFLFFLLWFVGGGVLCLKTSLFTANVFQELWMYYRYWLVWLLALYTSWWWFLAPWLLGFWAFDGLLAIIVNFIGGNLEHSGFRVTCPIYVLI